MTSVGAKLLMLLVSLGLLVGLSRGALALQVGEQAPDFELESTSGAKIKLSSLRGKNVLLNFYILDFTPT